LRTRHEDIVLLADHFLARLAGRMTAVPSLSTQALDRLLTHGWPAMSAELEHTLTAAATMTDGPEIRPAICIWPAPTRCLMLLASMTS